MNLSASIFPSIFNSIPEHIAILDEHGTIQLVNSAWEKYAQRNGGSPAQTGTGVNYLDICDSSSKAGDVNAQLVAANLRQLFEDKSTHFSLDYPCHSPTEKQWFRIKGWPLQFEDEVYSIVFHEDVTNTSLLIEELRSQTLTDSLTNTANRRHFDQFLNQEWRRCMRNESPLSMIMLDVDFFKLFNDRYGHAAGDTCLKSVASSLKSFARRPGDLAVRYGGEEFILLLSDTSLEAATKMAHRLCASIQDLDIPNEDSTVSSSVTASLGVASMIPRQGLSETVLLSIADQALYTAKNTGRNKVAQSNLRFI